MKDLFTLSPQFTRRRFLTASAGLAAWSSAGARTPPRVAPVPSTPRFVVREAFASKHVAPRKVIVWLPPGYDDQPAARYSVLYMHDGQNLFDPETAMARQPWAVDQHLIALQQANKIRPTMVVGIWNTPKRFYEYAPAAAFDSASTSVREALAKEPILSDAYLNFIVEELKPFIDKTFRTGREQSDTFIMGSSMGGLISLYALASYPAVFGGAGCLSTHWPVSTDYAKLAKGDADIEKLAAAYRDWLVTHLPAPGKHRFYFDHGSINLDALYAPHQMKVDALMEQKGFQRGKDWLTQTFPGADHNEPAWRSRLDIPLSFLLRPSWGKV